MPNFVPISESLRKVFRGSPCEHLTTPEARDSSTALNAMLTASVIVNETPKNLLSEDDTMKIQTIPQDINNSLHVGENKAHNEGGNGQLTHVNLVPNSTDEIEDESEFFDNMNNFSLGNSFILDIDFGGDSETVKHQDVGWAHKGVEKNQEKHGKHHSEKKQKKYFVSESLTHRWRTQAHFFSNIMLIKALQCISITLWTYILIYAFEDELITYCHTIQLSVMCYCFIQKLLLFCSSNYCTNPNNSSDRISHVCWLFLCSFIETFGLAGSCAAISVYYDTTIFLSVIWILSLSYIAVSIIPYTTKSLIVRWKHVGLMSAVIFFVSTIFVLFKLYQIHDSYIHYFLTVYVPATLISVVIILASQLWIRLIISGRAFNVHEKDWLYVAIFV